MQTVVLMRHAKAKSEESAERDFDRRLTQQGRRIAQQTAQQLSEAGIVIDRVIVSAARRAAETGQIVAAAACPAAPLLALEELYHASAEGYVASLREHADPADKTVLIVGHNPGIGELMNLWADAPLAVPPATTAVFRFNAPDWSGLALRRDPRQGRLDLVITHGVKMSPD